MNKIVLLTEKSWHKDLLNNLKKQFKEIEWILIDTKKEFTLDKIKAINPSKIFIPHWSYIIPSSIYSNYECIVFHMTDLPYGRGGSPLQNLIVRGFEKTKITALKVEKEIDAGGVYFKKELSLLGTAEEIFLRASIVIKEMIVEIFQKNLFPKEQEGEPVFFKRRIPEMSKVNSDINKIGEIYNHIRMLDAEGYPKAYIDLDNFRIEFSRASLKANQTIIADVRIIKK